MKVNASRFTRGRRGVNGGGRRHRMGLTAIMCSAVFVAGGTVVTPIGLAAPGDGTQFPWEGYDSPDAAAPVGAGFNLNASDMRFILDQIKIAEQHAATATPLNPCGTLVGGGPNQIPDAATGGELLPWGLRTVDGTCNNIVPGGENWGAADELMPRLGPIDLRAAEPFDPDGPGPAPSAPTSYTQTTGIVADSEPRIVSNLIVDQTAANPAAVVAAGANPEVDPISGTLFIPNVAPDEGLSAPYNSIFTLFGQFFDHGLDLVGKGGSGTVFIPLQPDDPLYISGSPTNFMVLTRATNQPGLDGLMGTLDDVHEHTNSTTPFVDQNQTYTSHPSHQVFLREYALNGAGDPVSTGELIKVDGGMATWDAVQLQSEDLLGIALADTDVLNVPLLATDPYGKFIPGAAGYPQIVTATGLVEGDPTANGGTGLTIPANALRTGHAFLDDIAHHAAPGTWDHDSNPGTPKIPQTPDALAGFADDGLPGTYDDEMLGVHYIAGDGRANENIGLTSIHHVFHSEHNRLVPYMRNLITAADPTQVPEWQVSPGVWNGERLFQAAKFATEMQYQHLVFEEFGRKVQPLINVFSGYEADVEADIAAEFAHAVYRFGHSMLNEQVLRFEPDGTPNDISLFDAFLNPPSFLDGVGAAVYTPDEAAGAVFRGMTTQVGNEIDEFVTDALRNRLVGLPLDLSVLNMARARDTGIPTLNNARKAFHAATASAQLAPYESWFDYGLNISTPESLINFVAAYGTHPSIMTLDPDAGGPIVAGSNAARRAAAALLVAADPLNVDTPADAQDFLFSTGPWANVGTVSITGLDDIDLWMGGLAEAKAPFGGMLGSTFNYVFETQMERLQNGDRFYYLTRTAGLNLLVQLEGNSLAEMIMRNTNATNLPADVFSRPDYHFDLQFLGTTGPILDDPNTPYSEPALLVRMPDGTVRYSGGAHVAMHGTASGDRMRTGDGDDTLRGNDGNDRMEGGIGNDQAVGGLGDDIITDTFGDDVLKGGDGDDYLGSGPGFDLNQGGLGQDFIIGGSDITETFGGPDNDIIFAGDDADTIFGDDGDDWQEGGGGADLMQGDNGAPFFNDLNSAGNDVLIGDGGNDDYDSEGGDDVMVAGPGIERFEGHFGFDWAIYKGDSQPAEADLLLDLAPLPPGVITNRDRYDQTEGLSGHALNDNLRGSNDTSVEMVGSELDAAGIARVNGLASLLPPFAPSFTGGEIILGGLGSDIIEGRGGNDIIDGDVWFDVQLQAPNPATPNPIDVQLVDSLWAIRADVAAGLIDPGDIQIVRSIRNSGSTGTDTAVFSGPFADYDIAIVGGKLVVTHARGDGGAGGILDTGVDTITNVELLQFADQTVPNPLGSGLLRVTTTPAVPSRISVDGIVRHDWGLEWVTIPSGSHQICWSDVVGFTTPACQTVTVTTGQTTVVNGTFGQMGLLQAGVAPAGLPSTVYVDGVARDEYGLFAFMETGTREVCWGDVPGYQAPACQSVVVTAGALTSVTGTFVLNASPTPGPFPLSPHGFLRVETNPAVPGRIVVDGTPRADWGLTWMKMDPGSHQVCFTDVLGFVTPACQTVDVTLGNTTTVTGNYVQMGLMQVFVSPPGLPVDVLIDGVPRNQFGAYLFIEAGSYQVCGTGVIGFTSPLCQTVSVTGGAQTNVTLTYTP